MKIFCFRGKTAGFSIGEAGMDSTGAKIATLPQSALNKEPAGGSINEFAPPGEPL